MDESTRKLLNTIKNVLIINSMLTITFGLFSIYMHVSMMRTNASYRDTLASDEMMRGKIRVEMDPGKLRGFALGCLDQSAKDMATLNGVMNSLYSGCVGLFILPAITVWMAGSAVLQYRRRKDAA